MLNLIKVKIIIKLLPEFQLSSVGISSFPDNDIINKHMFFSRCLFGKNTGSYLYNFIKLKCLKEYSHRQSPRMTRWTYWKYNSIVQQDMGMTLCDSQVSYRMWT